MIKKALTVTIFATGLVLGGMGINGSLALANDQGNSASPPMGDLPPTGSATHPMPVNAGSSGAGGSGDTETAPKGKKHHKHKGAGGASGSSSDM